MEYCVAIFESTLIVGVYYAINRNYEFAIFNIYSLVFQKFEFLD